MWTDKVFFPSTVNLVFGSLGDKVPQDFSRIARNYVGRRST